jgi:DegV family protein with EDD domain
MLQIITDSASDLPEEIIRKYEIHVVPLTVKIDDQEFREGIDLTPQEFQVKMLQSRELPVTSQPPPALFSKAFQDLAEKGELLCLTLSSKLSGTFHSAVLARKETGLKVEIFDTLAGSLGQGLQAIKAAEFAGQGLALPEIIEKLSQYRKEMNILILLDTLENIVKGGRLNTFQGSLAKILNVKVLLQGVEGAVEILEKVRGKRRFLERVIEVIGERGHNLSERVFGITHVDNMEDVQYLKEAIMNRYKPKDVLVNYMGSTMGTYAGKGGIIIAF